MSETFWAVVIQDDGRESVVFPFYATQSQAVERAAAWAADIPEDRPRAVEVTVTWKVGDA